MSEPPMQVDPEGVGAAPRKVGHNVLDLTIAGVAILLSLISLGVAIENSRIQERLLTASSWPFVTFSHGDVGGEDVGVHAGGGKPIIFMALRNAGVGPAKIESVRMTWRGKPVTSVLAYMRECCGAQTPGGHFGHGLQVNTVSPGVLVAGQTAPFLVLPQSDEIGPVWSALDASRADLKISVCYCSVFDECWLTDGVSLHPPRVKACPKDAPQFAQ